MRTHHHARLDVVQAHGVRRVPARRRPFGIHDVVEKLVRHLAAELEVVAAAAEFPPEFCRQNVFWCKLCSGLSRFEFPTDKKIRTQQLT